MAAATAQAAPPLLVDTPSARELALGYREGRVLAKPRPEMVGQIDKIERAEGLSLRSRFERFGQVGVLGLPAGDTVMAAVKRLRATGRYLYVEPDYLRRPTVMAVVPNDPQFGNQWGLHNDGSNAGIAGADINAEAGWETLTGAPGIIVGMLDSGALTTHEDLLANLWVNMAPGTTLSYPTVPSFSGGASSVSETDSLNGLNAVTMTGIPTDDLGHGTATSGVVGAVGNNLLGVAGVAWKVQLMELKFISGTTGSGSIADELPCIEYAIAHGVKVINASFGERDFSQAEMDGFFTAGQAGIIFVCAAGNNSENNDVSSFYPSDYPLDNIISVGATDNRDDLAFFSNFGSGSVEIFAPGDSILSTFNASNSSYSYLSGTSLAAPFVTGTVALLRALHPSDTYRETINRVINSADRIPGLAGLALTGGRLNLATALTTAANTPPNALFENRTNLVGLDPYTRSNNTDTPLALEAGVVALSPGAGHSLWWQWTAPQTAMVEIDTSGTEGGVIPGGSGYATALGVYTGASISTLAPVASNVVFGTEPAEGTAIPVPYSEVKFQATAGTVYQINVQGQTGASGQTILAINTIPTNDDIAQAAVLTGLSASANGINNNATREPGETPVLNTRGGYSVWYSWTAPKSGPAQFSGYSYDFAPAVGVYTGTSFSNLSLVTAAEGAALSGTTTDISECLCTISAVAGTTYLISVDTADGELGQFTVTVDDSIWQAATGDAITCTPAVAPDGTVYVGSDDNSISAFGPGGNLEWSHVEGSAFDTSAAVVGPDGTIYAANLGGLLYAFNPADGSTKWTYAVPGSAGSSSSGNGITASPALAADGTIYIHSTDGNLYALNPDKSLKWTAPVPGGSYAAATIGGDGTIYIGTDTGTLYAVNPDGSQKWAFATPAIGEAIYTAAAIDAAGNLYFGTLTGNVYSVDPSGNLRWTFPVGNGVTSAPALANGSVYFGGYDGKLYALSAASGALQWAFNLGTQVRASAPAVDSGGTVYIGCYDHNVYAVSAGGTLVRTYATSDVIRSSPVISGSTLYFGSSDHKLYAFSIGTTAASSDWPMYQYDARHPGRAENGALGITAQPESQNVTPGSPLTLSVAASGSGTLSYQWSLNGSAIAGATNATYSVASASTADAGSYTVTVTDTSGSVTSAAAAVTVGASSGKIVNLSARADVGTGGNILIAGFVIRGTGGKEVVLRGIGPTLGTAPFNVPGSLATPQLSLISSTGQQLSTSTSWGGGAALAGAFSQVGAFELAPTSADAAVETTLAPGAYTSEIAGVNSTTGVALAEIYDADPGSTASELVNISARADVGTGGNILIAGFVIEGSQPVRLLLRGIGPTLGAAPFSVPGVIALPQIDLFNSAGTKLQSNSGWNGDPTLAAAFATVGAFPLTAGSADTAMIVTLPAGGYTVQLSGQNGSQGVGLIEIYLMP